MWFNKQNKNSTVAKSSMKNKPIVEFLIKWEIQNDRETIIIGYPPYVDYYVYSHDIYIYIFSTVAGLRIS